ncbi:hypothetical protein IQ264_07870 [Phormidium sp. LEGE 05292]|uniref:hypothetical protein n=1 Tax=[Phormidium] sp. LEGE 05292 TaxID=767427 RepID=UPI001881B671|nr:hypothetical protein [Phormidium sp. LEGE 05292]MBE9225348.1 hypothetical protein [Phormidium sp. LEGE 05292]
MLSQSFVSQPKINQLRVIRIPSFDNTVSNIEIDELPSQFNKQGKHIAAAQERIWLFFLNVAKSAAPEIVLTKFEKLFINPSFDCNLEIEKALKIIVLSQNEQEFRNTLKRCIYILLNTWIYSRKYQYAQILIEKLSVPHLNYSGSSTFLRSLRSWIINFMKSQDYQEVKLFASRYDRQQTGNWKSRYTSYLLTPQYLNSENSLEQRQAARRLSQQLQDKYKFDLAMYTVHSNRTLSSKSKVKNPTALGDEALRLIKKVLAKNGAFSHVNLAAIFLNQTQGISYRQFKQSLLNYLIFSLESAEIVKSIKMQLTQKLDALYQHEDRQALQNILILRTANRMIEYLTIDKNNQPSELFVLIASQGNALTLGILLLKVLLISPHSRTFLELCMSKLVDYYGNYSEQDCQWVINFLEVIQIILTLYTGDIKYNLVNMEQETSPSQIMIDENSYRIFPQIHGEGYLSQN